MKSVSIFLLFYLCICCNIFAQITNTRKKYVSKSSFQNNIISEKDYIITSYDTLINVSKPFDSTIFSYKKIKPSKEILKKYIEQILATGYIYQWSCPIIIYINKSLGENNIDEFTSYIKELNTVKNLNISITTKLNKANYLIKTVDSYAGSYPIEKLNTTPQASKKSMPFKYMTYNLLADKNRKYYGATVIINKDSLKSNNKSIGKLKKLFFHSLTSFPTSQHSVEKSSMIHSEYKDSLHVSEFDLTILKMHYVNIHDEIIDSKTYYNITKNINRDEN